MAYKIILCENCVNQEKARPFQEMALKDHGLKKLHCNSCKEEIKNKFFILEKGEKKPSQ